MNEKVRKTVNENDAFITLIRVAQEDPGIRQTLAGILRQPPFHRKALLNTLIREMTLQRAPADFISAMNELLDDDVAEKAAAVVDRI